MDYVIRGINRLNEYIDNEFKQAKAYEGLKDGSHESMLHNNTMYYELIKLRDEVIKAHKIGESDYDIKDMIEEQKRGQD